MLYRRLGSAMEKIPLKTFLDPESALGDYENLMFTHLPKDTYMVKFLRRSGTV